ncbi:MAG TPA: DUF6034 family protein [Eubacteriales bacterium]|nr:DUF6034 family protein [Eubacteriales bacterium]
MKRTISILLIITIALAFAACGKTADVTVVPTDTERIVELSLDSENDTADVSQAEETLQTPEVEYTQEYYVFSTTAADGLLTVDAAAQVLYPASLQMPVARVNAVGFTQEQASAYFDYLFAGEQPIVVENHGAAKITKQSLRDQIALYEQQIADGTTMTQSLLTEDEAREEIERLEEQIPDAPDTVSPDVISDGTMLSGVRMHNDDPEELLELNVETDNKWLDIYTPVNPDEHAEGHFFYNRKDKDIIYESEATPLAQGTSIEGMNMTWDDAVAVCMEFLAVGGVNDMTVGQAFQLEADGNYAYRFYFVRTVAGVPLAVNHEGTDYKGVNTPWGYEELHITVDGDGLLDVGWGSPVETTEIVNTAADVISFSQAAEIFETMAAEVYEPSTVRYDGEKREAGVSVDEIVLSMLRIRDVSTDERTGLYVPAWVFYGETTVGGNPNKSWEPQIVFAINAVDGSVINMELGY